MTYTENEKQTTSLQLSKDSAPELVKGYFEKILEIKQSGKEFPINLDEVWSLAYVRKQAAVRVLKSDFIEGVDFQALTRNGERGAASPTDYYLTVECLEYFVAKKVKSVFEVYRRVFHATIENGQQQPQLSEKASAYQENQLFLAKLGSSTVKGYFSGGELYFGLGTILRFFGYEGGGGHVYAKKFGEGYSRLVDDGKASVWFVNLRWVDNFLNSVKREIPYERIVTLYRDLFRIEKGDGAGGESPYTYHYTIEEIMSIIAEVNKFKQKPALIQSINDKLLQGGGRK